MITLEHIGFAYIGIAVFLGGTLIYRLFKGESFTSIYPDVILVYGLSFIGVLVVMIG